MEGRICPDIELQNPRIIFEPICELVLGSEDLDTLSLNHIAYTESTYRPTWREWQVRHVIVPTS